MDGNSSSNSGTAICDVARVLLPQARTISRFPLLTFWSEETTRHGIDTTPSLSLGLQPESKQTYATVISFCLHIIVLCVPCHVLLLIKMDMSLFSHAAGCCRRCVAGACLLCPIDLLMCSSSNMERTGTSQFAFLHFQLDLLHHSD